MSLLILASFSLSYQQYTLNASLVLGTQPPSTTTCNAIKSVYQHSSLSNGGNGCCGNEDSSLDVPECNAIDINFYTYDLPLKYSNSSVSPVFLIHTYDSLEELEAWKKAGERLFTNYRVTHTAVGDQTTWKARFAEPMFSWSANKTDNTSGVMFYTAQFLSIEDVEVHAHYGPRSDYEVEANGEWVFGTNAEGGYNNRFQNDIRTVNIGIIPKFNLEQTKMVDTLFDNHYPVRDYSQYGFYTSVNRYLPYPPVTKNCKPMTIVLVNSSTYTALEAAQHLMQIIKNPDLVGPVTPHGRSDPAFGLTTGSLTHPFVLDAFSAHSDTDVWFSYVVAYFMDIVSINAFRTLTNYTDWTVSYESNILINTLDSNQYEDLKIFDLLTE